MASIKILFIVALASVAFGQNCCAPSQWTISGTESNVFGTVRHQIYYDSVNLLVRWDKAGNLFSSSSVSTLIVWVNYTSLTGWAYFPTQNNTCEGLGPDHFEKWCFGSDQSQSYSGTVSIAGSNVTRWVNTANGFTWYNTVAGCVPVAIQHGNDMLLFYNVQAGPIDPNVWKYPTEFCHQSTAEGTNLLEKLSSTGSMHSHLMKKLTL